MSTFLTPPVWYGSSGEKDNSLVNTKVYAVGGPDNTPFGYLAVAGNPNGDSFGTVAIGCQAQATASKAIAIGSYDKNGTNRDVTAAGTGSIAIGAGAKVEATGGMAIGQGSSALEGGIAIGEGASATGNMIQIGNPSTRYDLMVGNGNVSIGNFTITQIKNGAYINQVILDNVNQIKSPIDGISFEVGERRDVGTVIYPTKIKTLVVDSNECKVGTISKTSTSGSATLDANCLYVINFGSSRAMLHTTKNNSNSHQFIYSLNATTDYVMYINNVLSDTTSVTCKIQKYDKNNNSYTDYTNIEFTATKVCYFT